MLMPKFVRHAMTLSLVKAIPSASVLAVALGFTPSSAQAADGVATHFDSLGIPFGGCGVPEAHLGTTDYVALNVQHTPGDYTSQLARPLAGQALVGAWDNGRNCGRWVRVTMGAACVGGTNSGQPGTQICQGGSWRGNSVTGAALDMLVADSCQDGNTWCRDNWGHLDLATAALAHFQKDGRTINLMAEEWTNPQISWQFIDAPNYRGDIEIAFAQHAQPYWPAIVITHLPRGIHGVEALVDGTWQAARMNSDMGQAFVLPANAHGAFSIRVYDADDQLLNGGRVYTFRLPKACLGRCEEPYQAVSYSTVTP